jgi:hypothetical protein
MLADPKARALTDNFASQWLLLRQSQGHVPTPGDFPNFDNELRQAFPPGNGVFFQSIVRGQPQRSRPDQRRLHLRQRAAGAPLRHAERVRRNFRRVDRANPVRPRLLGQGSVLTVTSYPNRTSPVLRGKYILENILGTRRRAAPRTLPAPLGQRGGRNRSRCASGSNCTAAPRRAPAATG